MLLSVHDNLLLLSESQCRGEYWIKINLYKKVSFIQATLLEQYEYWVEPARIWWKWRDSANILFILPNSPTEIFPFIYLHFVVWFWAKYLIPLISSFIICKMEVIIVFISKVILELKEILLVKCNICTTSLGKKCSDSDYSLWMSSEFSQQSVKKKKTKYNMSW